MSRISSPSEMKTAFKIHAANFRFLELRDEAVAERPPKGDTTPAYFLQDDGWKTVQTNAEFAAQHQCSFWKPILLYK